MVYNSWIDTESSTYRWLPLHMSLIFLISSNLSGSLLVIMQFQRWFVTFLIRKLFLSRRSNPSSGGISTLITWKVIGMSSVDPDVSSIRSAIPLDLTNVSSNLKSLLEYIMMIDKRPKWRTSLSVHRILCINGVQRYQHRITWGELWRPHILEKMYKL